MRTSLSILITFALFISTWTQDCNNPLLDVYNLTGLTSPESGSALMYCSNLQNGQTCCSADTVSSFQSLLDNTKAQLQALTGARDQYLVQLRNNYLGQFEQLTDSLQSYTSDIPTITAENSTLGGNLTNETNTFIDISNSLNNIDNDFNGALQQYQAARATCFENLLEVQSSAWCLACDPDYAASGVLANGTIAFSNDICTAISTACYPFLQAADGFNPLIRARESYSRLQDLTNYLAEFDTTSAIPNRTIDASSWTSTNATELTVAIPSGCDSASNCPWQCDNLFPGGVLNQTVAASGAGVLGGNDVDFGTLGFVVVPNDTNTNNAANATNDANSNTTDATNNTTTNATNTTNDATNSTAPNDANSTTTDATNSTTTNAANTTNDANSNTTDTTNSTAPNATIATARRRNVTSRRTARNRRTASNSTGKRLLQSTNQGTWSPNLGATGLDTAVIPDPEGIFAVNSNGVIEEESVVTSEAESNQEAESNVTTAAPVVATNSPDKSTTAPANQAAPAAVAPANTGDSAAPATRDTIDNDVATSAFKLTVGVTSIILLISAALL